MLFLNETKECLLAKIVLEQEWFLAHCPVGGARFRHIGGPYGPDQPTLCRLQKLPTHCIGEYTKDETCTLIMRNVRPPLPLWYSCYRHWVKMSACFCWRWTQILNCQRSLHAALIMSWLTNFNIASSAITCTFPHFFSIYLSLSHTHIHKLTHTQLHNHTHSHTNTETHANTHKHINTQTYFLSISLYFSLSLSLSLVPKTENPFTGISSPPNDNINISQWHLAFLH